MVPEELESLTCRLMQIADTAKKSVFYHVLPQGGILRLLKVYHNLPSSLFYHGTTLR